MRNENFFEKKLEISKDTLGYTKSQLDHYDIQIKTLTNKYEYELELYNKKVTRLQEIKKQTEINILAIQKRIDHGYKFMDIRTGKAYKTFDEIHRADLARKAKESEDNYKAMKKAYNTKTVLREEARRKKELLKLGEEEDEVETQTKRELRLQKERYEELLAEKEALELKEKELAKKKKEAEKTKKITPIAEIAIPEGIADSPFEEDELFIPVEIKEELPELKSIDTPVSKDIEVVKEALEELDKGIEANIIKNSNGELRELEWLLTTHQDWIEEYNIQEGGNAVWQGRITNGFTAWCDLKGYKIGD